MFVVGKKYKYKKELYVYDCLYVTQRSTLLTTGANVSLPNKECLVDVNHDDWTEYHEPVVVKAVRHVSFSERERTDPIWTTRADTKFDVGKVEFTVTDGKLTDVRIL